MRQGTVDIIKRLARIQANLREELLEKLEAQGEDLETIFDPYSFSPVVQELREKYLNRLLVIQGLIQQLTHLGTGRSKNSTRVVRLQADEQPELVKRVNRKLAALNGAKVLDVEFLPKGEEDEWVALITFVPNPLSTEHDESTAMM